MHINDIKLGNINYDSWLKNEQIMLNLNKFINWLLNFINLLLLKLLVGIF